MLPHALSLGKGFLSYICSHIAHFEMFVWILNGFCGMGYRHIQKKTWVLWHTIQSSRPLWIWHPLWIAFDIAETFCWYEHLVMMFRHVCKWLYISSRQRHYTSLQVLYRDTGIVIATIAMPRTKILCCDCCEDVFNSLLQKCHGHSNRFWMTMELPGIFFFFTQLMFFLSV